MDFAECLAETFEELRTIYPEIGDRTLAQLRADPRSILHNPYDDFCWDLYMLAALKQLASEREERERQK
jgi:hypothetical protein